MLLPHPFHTNHPLFTRDIPLTQSLSTKDLPPSYQRLLARQNGGYVRDFVVPTEEPTSDGLDHAHIHYLFGLHENPQGSLLNQHTWRKKAQLPEYLLIFSAHKAQFFAFDYSRISASGEPAIRYLDVETDNWQVVAPDFPSFVKALEPGEIHIPLAGQLSQMEAEHAFLLAESAERLAELFWHLEAVSDKAWYFRWLTYFSNHKNVSFRSVCLDAWQTQVLYFRRQLPPNTQQVLEQFLHDSDTHLREKAKLLLAEWPESEY